MVKEITSENFEKEVLQAEKPVLLDFWASWCGPCSMLSPIVDQFAREHTQYIVGKVNVDEQGELAQKFSVMSIPTLIAFKNGEVSAKSVGVISKDKIEDLLNQ